jgi:hypothetical protein
MDIGSIILEQTCNVLDALIDEMDKNDLFDEFMVYTENAKQSRRKRRHKRQMLKRIDYDPDTGTYKSKMKDENNNRVRVPLELNGDDDYATRSATGNKITLTSKTAHSPRHVQDTVLGHEEGHINQFRTNETGKQLRKTYANAEAFDNEANKRRPGSGWMHGNAKPEHDADMYMATNYPKGKQKFIKTFTMDTKQRARILNKIKNDVNKLSIIEIRERSETENPKDIVDVTTKQVLRKSRRSIYADAVKKLDDALNTLKLDLEELDRIKKEEERQKEAYEFEKKMSQQVDPGEILSSKVNRNKADTANVDINDLTKVNDEEWDFGWDDKKTRKELEKEIDDLKKLLNGDNPEIVNQMRQQIIQDFEKYNLRCQQELKHRIAFVKKYVKEYYIAIDDESDTTLIEG